MESQYSAKFSSHSMWIDFSSMNRTQFHFINTIWNLFAHCYRISLIFTLIENNFIWNFLQFYCVFCVHTSKDHLTLHLIKRHHKPSSKCLSAFPFFAVYFYFTFLAERWRSYVQLISKLITASWSVCSSSKYFLNFKACSHPMCLLKTDCIKCMHACSASK